MLLFHFNIIVLYFYYTLFNINLCCALIFLFDLLFLRFSFLLFPILSQFILILFVSSFDKTREETTTATATITTKCVQDDTHTHTRIQIRTELTHFIINNIKLLICKLINKRINLSLFLFHLLTKRQKK